MKTLLIICFISINLTAQDKRFTLSAQSELADKNTHNDEFDYGFNIGLSVDYQMSLNYFSAEIFVFPDLNNNDYFHFEGTLLGFNFFDADVCWRYYIGVLKGGFVVREDTFGPMVGFDAGVEHYFKDFFIGIDGGFDWKTDDKAWDVNGTGHGVWFTAFKIGIKL
jgi:hypothetical protein